jgi:ankyrin repeat protein
MPHLFGNPELHQALMSGDLAAMGKLHAKGVNWNVSDGTYGTPLTLAIQMQNPPMLKFLLEHGADPNFVAKGIHDTPLATAAMHKEAGMVRLLLAKGADPNRLSADGSNALASSLAIESLEITQLLLDAGADVLHKNKYGVNALAMVELGRNKKLRALVVQAARKMPTSNDPMTAAKLGQVSTIQQWLQSNPTKDLKARVATIAASAGQAEVVKLVLEHQLDPNALGRPEDNNIHVKKEPLLFWAIGEGHAEVVRILLDAGADLNKPTPLNGASPLLSAVACGKPEIVKLLLDRGADPMQADSRGDTPLSLAQERGLKQMYKLLQKHMSSTTVTTGSLPLAAKNGLIDEVKRYLQQKADLETHDDQGVTALQWAVALKNVPMLKLLLEHGAKAQPTTALSTWDHALSFDSKPEIIHALIEAGLEVNQRQFTVRNLLTPLQYAAMTVSKHAEEVLGIMIDAGADTKVIHTPEVPPEMKKALDGLKAVGSKVGRKIGEPQTLIELASSNRKAAAYLKTRLGIARDHYDLALEQAKQLAATLATEPMMKLVAEVSKRLGKQGQPWKKRKGVLSFWVKLTKVFPGSEADAGEAFRQLAHDVQQRGGHLVYHRLPEGSEAKTELLFFPTSNPLVPLACSGVNGDNYGLTTRDVVKWFGDEQKAHPFLVKGCSYDFVDVRFTTPMKDVKAFVKKLVEFCPDMDEGEGTRDVAAELARSGDCFFWWD